MSGFGSGCVRLWFVVVICYARGWVMNKVVVRERKDLVLKAGLVGFMEGMGVDVGVGLVG